MDYNLNPPYLPFPYLNLTDYRRVPKWELPINNINSLLSCLNNNIVPFEYYNVRDIVAHVRTTDHIHHWILDMGNEQYLHLIGYDHLRTAYGFVAHTPRAAAGYGSEVTADWRGELCELDNQVNEWEAYQHNAQQYANQYARDTYVEVNGVQRDVTVNTDKRFVFIQKEEEENLMRKYVKDVDVNKFGSTPLSGAYTETSTPATVKKFGDDVAKHWDKPVKQSAAASPSVKLVPPSKPLFKDVDEVELDQSTGLYKHNYAMTCEPVEGVHMLLHISSKHLGIDEDVLLNGLFKLAEYIREVGKQERM